MTTRRILSLGAPEVAPRLLGATLTSSVDGRTVAVRITEVEAYRFDDPASHSYGGQTARNASMFGAPGTLYVYRSYGIHWCANVVTGPPGEASAVLLRGGIPIEGIDVMMERRGRQDHLTDGPGKLCQAMAITGADDGLDLLSGERISLGPGVEPHSPIHTGPRVGITKAIDVPWRFWVDTTPARRQ